MAYQKGESGNPAGRPHGIADKRTELRALLRPHADALVAKAVERALEGDTTALRICLDRLIPPIKAADTPVQLDLSGSLADQGRVVLAALGEGTVTPEQAAGLLQAIAAQGRIIEVHDLEERLARLESALKPGRTPPPG